MTASSPQMSSGGNVRANILWILGEDVGQDLGAYGNRDVQTPNLDRLAAQGRLYHNAFSTAPVCSPARSALITGMYQTSIGAHHHRSHRHDGYRLPEGVLLVPERLRAAGYFTVNVTRFPESALLGVSSKQDWNFTPPEGIWDSTDWSDLAAQQPFFAMINMAETHRPYKRGAAEPAIATDSLTSLPPYVADSPLTREDWAAYLETVQLLDDKVGRILALLDAAGLADNTVVMFLADHGREDFRGKSTAYDAGTRVPLIVRWPGQVAPGETTGQLVSMLDVTAATLALAGVDAPGLHGVNFLGDGHRAFVFTAKDRIETVVDRVRTVFDGRYRYIRNFMPDQPHFIERAYYDRTNPVRAFMREQFAAGNLTPAQAKVFAPVRPPEELYDLLTDPGEFDNLAADSSPESQAALARLRAALDDCLVTTGDQGALPEDPEAVDLGGGPGGRKSRGTPADGKSVDSARPEARPAWPLGASGDPLALAGSGVAFIGGREVTVRGGGRRAGAGEQHMVVDQAPVHYFIPEQRSQSRPVVMVPGHGLTSYLYLATPDGREGWAQRFARAGYAAYVMDVPGYTIAGFDLNPFEAVRSGQAAPDALPSLGHWTNESAWTTWGFGPEPGVAFEDSRYPLDHVGQLYASITTVVGSSDRGGQRGRFGSGVIAEAVINLLEAQGQRGIMIVHSAAGAAGIEVLRRRPELVAALIMVEPVGSPSDPAEVESLFVDTELLAVFGDHFDARGMQGRYEAAVETARLVATFGGRSAVWRLPDEDIRGNSHLLMQDDNSHAIAARIVAWLRGGRS